MEISICLTDLGELTLSSNVDIYSNYDNYTTPIYTNVPVSSLYGANCSFTATVPSGTTSIQLFDPIVNCTSTVVTISSNICVDCNLGFDVYTATSVGRIIAGNLIDSCSATTITDYIIDWYGPNSSTNIGYTSGFGSAFPGWNYQHPLTGATAIFAQSGTYFPKIRKIKINGIVYTQSGGTGSVLANLACITGTTITVLPFTCTNGSSSLSQYTHEVNFQSFSLGATPPPAEATIELSSTTKYFAFAFRAREIADTLTFTFSGSSYGGPIVIESLRTGTGAELNVGTNSLSPNIVTKTGRTNFDGYIAKVLNLTGLTINNGDKIIISVTPNPNNNQTDWFLFFNSCLTSFDCNHCLTNPSPNYKISGSTIQLIQADCGAKQPQFRMSGCTNTFLQSDFYKYIFFSGSSTSFSQPSVYHVAPWSSLFTSNGITPNITSQYFILPRKFCNGPGSGPSAFCATSNNNLIRYVKTNTMSGEGNFQMFFSNISDYNFYLNAINNVRNNLLNQCDPLYVVDESNIGYFKYFSIKFPGNVSGNVECGDGNIPKDFVFHVSSVITTSIIGGLYSINLSMPIINNLVPFVSCEGCNSVADTIKNKINNDSLSTSNQIDLTSNRGSRYVDVVGFRYISQTKQTQTKVPFQGDFSVGKYFNETYMYSGSPLSLIPSLTAQTCDLNSYMTLDLKNLSLNDSNYIKRYYDYTFVLLDQLNNLAVLDGNGVLDTSFQYGVGFDESTGVTRTIKVQSNDQIVVGGDFTQYNYSSANRLVRLNPNGSVDSVFLSTIGAGANAGIRTLDIQNSGEIILGGNFTQFNSTTANRLIRLLSDGSIDSSFLTALGTGFNDGSVLKVKVQIDGKILVGGSFTQFNNLSATRLMRLNPNGTRDFSLVSSPNNFIHDFDTQTDGKIVLGGDFTTYNSTSSNRIARISNTGVIDSTFTVNIGTGFNGTVRAVLIQPNDKIICGGDFTSFNGVAARGIIRLEPNGLIDTTFLTNIGDSFKVNDNPLCSQGVVYSLRLQPDGKIIVGGNFKLFDGVAKESILRLNPLGTLDTTFGSSIGFGTSTIYGIDINSFGDIVTCGQFSSYQNYPNNVDNFGITTRLFSNGLPTGTPFYIYKYSGGTVTYSDPTYII